MKKYPSCPICGPARLSPWAQARDLEYFTTPDTFQYLKCASCGSLLIHPVPFRQLSLIYPGNYYSFTGGKASLVEKVKQALDRRSLGRLLEKIPGKSMDVLDVGGGTGWMLDLLKSADPRVSFTQVVDMDPKAGKRAKAKGHAYYQGPIESFKTGRKFHLVLLFNLIEHVKDPVGVLKKIERLLAPGGLLLVKTPNIDSLDARLFRRLNWGGYHCPRHWVLFNEAGFRKAAGKTRLKISSLAYTQGAPFWAQSVMMLLFRWRLIRYSRQKPLVCHPFFPLLAALFAGFDFLRGLFFKTSQMMVLLKKTS